MAHSFDQSLMILPLIVLGISFLILSFFSIQTGLVLMIFAMLFSPEFEVGKIGIRSLIIRIEDVLIPILIMAWLSRLAIRKEHLLIKSNPLNRPMASVIIISLISTFWGMSQGSFSSPLPSVFYFLKTMEFFFIFFLTVNYVRTIRQIKLFLFFALLTVTFIGIYTLFQVPHTQIFSEHRITAPFEGIPQPATVGGYMAFLLLIIFGLFLCEDTPVRRILYLIMGTTIFIPFLYTFNRTSYMALAVGLIFLSLLVRRVWLFVLLPIVLLSSPLWAPKSVKERIAFTWEDGVYERREFGVDVSFQERIHQYKKLWNSVHESPIIGLGIGSWEYLDSQYARTFHEVGAIGLGLWLWIFLRLFRMSFWLFKTLLNGSLRGMSLGYAAGLAGLLVHSFGVITFYVVRIMEPFWFISGLIVSLYSIKVSEAVEERALEEVVSS